MKRNGSRFLVVLLFSVVAVTASCQLRPVSTTCDCVNDEIGRTPLIDSADLALVVARAHLSSQMDLALVDPTVTEDVDTWTIEFDLKPEHKGRLGGRAFVVVEKMNGEIRSSYVGK